MDATWLSLLQGKAPWLVARQDLFLPWLISLAIAWMDVRSRRIPNYLTLGGAAAGMGYQLGSYGWPGLADSLAGLILGLALLLLPYLKGGMGAGDVKALAAMGAWLGLQRTFHLFIYMGLSGGLIIVVVLWRRGLLGSTMRQGWVWLVNLLLCAPSGAGPRLPASPKSKTIPYGSALALGMTVLGWRWQDG